ncbi:unnamed protein product [Rhodiola kirilowii]
MAEADDDSVSLETRPGILMVGSSNVRQTHAPLPITPNRSR